jgi:hypothetical protein
LSHLSILPTVLRDADCLAATLAALGLPPEPGGELHGFSGEGEAVLLRVTLPDGISLGWCRQHDGSLALVGDLQVLSRARELPALLGRITRDYAARLALRQAAAALPEAVLQVGA